MMTALKAPFTCGKMRVGARNTIEIAAQASAVNEALSRLNTTHMGRALAHVVAGFWAGESVRKAGCMAISMCSTPARHVTLEKVASGFPSNQIGTEAMTATRKTLVLPQHTHALPQSEQADLIQLHAQAIDGLNAALTHLTTPSDAPQVVILSRALSRTIRASTVLKRACSALNQEVAT